jgi:hypothetical protein
MRGKLVQHQSRLIVFGHQYVEFGTAMHALPIEKGN